MKVRTATENRKILAKAIEGYAIFEDGLCVAPSDFDILKIAINNNRDITIDEEDKVITIWC